MIEKSELKKLDGKICPLYDKDRNVIGEARLYFEEGVLKSIMEMKDGKKFEGIVNVGKRDLMDPS